MAMTAPSSSDLTRAPLTMFSEEEELFRAAVADLAESEVRPRVRAMEDAGQIDPALTAKFVELGLMGIELPDEFGGAGGSLMMVAIAVEELSKVDASAAIQVDVQNTLVNYPLYRYGSAEQRARILPRMTAGTIGAYALSEPGSGSDAFGLATRAEKVDGGWTLNGSKAWITNGNEADVFVVFANTRPDMGYKGITAFIVERDTPGVTIGKPEKKMGQQGANVCDVIFEDARVPITSRLGEEGEGMKVAMSVLDRGRLHISALSVGIAERLVEEMVRYASERKQFGKPIIEHQLVMGMIAESYAEAAAGRAMVMDGVRKYDAKEKTALIASATKMWCTEMVGRVADRAVQVHGGAGYIADYAVERFYRDVRILRLYEGTTQIQQMVIGRELQRMAKAGEI